MISVFGSNVGKEEIEEIKTSIESQWIGIGPKTKRFEDEFRTRLNLADFTMLNSGSNSLYMAVKLLELPKGSEVIVPSFTWIACAHAIVLAGCRPVFCDVDLETQNVTAKTIKPCITKKTKAIMVVHYAGKPVKMQEIIKFGIPIIEDAAHAVDSKIGNKYCGSMGDIGVYSFDAVKNLSIGEAGGLTAKKKELVDKARILRYCGIGKSGFESSASKDRWWEYNIVDFFPKLIPDDISASMGIAQLKKIDTHQAIRKNIWERYQKELVVVDWLDLPKGPESNEQHSYFTYCIRLKNKKRDKLAKYLYENGIYTTLRFHPLHLNPIYRSKVKLPNSEKLNDIALNIPIHPSLSEIDVSYVIEKIKAFNG
ncbi:MAG: DegT/DnrJ/EryC1/StrS family aminotransferase [Candidatus Omnitrophota bacterium]